MQTNGNDQDVDRAADDAKPDEMSKKMDKAPERVQSPPHYVQGPVPMEKHYDVFKTTEEKIQRHLEGLDHEYHLTGFRVAYDLRDSSNEPGVYPHTLEFGSLELIDLVVKCLEPAEITEEEPKKLNRNEPLPIDVLDALYNFADAALQAAAREVENKPEIRTGLFIVLAGSYSAYAVNCCPSPNSSKRLRTSVNWGRPTTTCSGSCR